MTAGFWPRLSFLALLAPGFACSSDDGSSTIEVPERMNEPEQDSVVLDEVAMAGPRSVLRDGGMTPATGGAAGAASGGAAGAGATSGAGGASTGGSAGEASGGEPAGACLPALSRCEGDMVGCCAGSVCVDSPDGTLRCRVTCTENAECGSQCCQEDALAGRRLCVEASLCG